MNAGHAFTYPMTKPDPDLLSIGEVARIVNVSVSTVRNWERAGLITSIRTPTNHRRFRRADVNAIIDGTQISA